MKQAGYLLQNFAMFLDIGQTSVPYQNCKEQIRLFHALIWLSLTTYAWEDYDSICGAFYKGLECLEEAL